MVETWPIPTARSVKRTPCRVRAHRKPTRDDTTRPEVRGDSAKRGAATCLNLERNGAERGRRPKSQDSTVGSHALGFPPVTEQGVPAKRKISPNNCALDRVWARTNDTVQPDLSRGFSSSTPPRSEVFSGLFAGPSISERTLAAVDCPLGLTTGTPVWGLSWIP